MTCDCNEAKQSCIILNRIGLLMAVKVLCRKCNTLWHVNNYEDGEIQSYTKGVF